ncbi:hypothetical protein GCM10009785_28060 [Brooklawnia cerclae]|uniref:Lysophospholipase L1-like esterase n=1 Tax=Brooklawnia cerclae TaxID=349934 RepID=A0ABX0SJI7_9ACTN|nr:SGNH/GDSL hydrolase family protein [Brooklawnia cerclae]NIH56902.1 lysophospholipase L1-like esterase [Brooklawnia cerclae]
MARRWNPRDWFTDDLRANIGLVGVPVLVVAIIALVVMAFQMQRSQQASVTARAQTSVTSTTSASAPASSHYPSASSVSPATQASSAAAPSTTLPVAVFVGDSYSLGAGGDGTNWTTLLSAAAGWTEVNLARGGTGYTTGSNGSTCALDYCPSYQEMIPEVAAADPDIVVVSGGRNDGSGFDREAIGTFYSSLRAAVPDARIIAVSPLWDSEPTPDWLVTLEEDVRYSVTTSGGEYADIGQPLLDHPELIATEGVYPNAEGYTVIASAIENVLGVG